MPSIVLSLHDQFVEVRYPANLDVEIGRLFVGRSKWSGPVGRNIEIRQVEGGGHSLSVNGSLRFAELDRTDLSPALIEEASHSLIVDLASAVALHAGSVGWREHSILIAGPSGSGKSSLVAWLVANGFDYLSDELVILTGGCRTVAFPRPLLLKAGSIAAVAAASLHERMRSIGSPSRPILVPVETAVDQGTRECSLVIFPHYREGVEARVTGLSAAQSGLRLMECNLNARNLSDHGFAAVTQFARDTPAVMLQYSSFDQLGGVVDLLARTIIEKSLDAAMTRRLLGAVGRTADATLAEREAGGRPRAVSPIPDPTPRTPAKKLTIGMATFDDYDGVYFTLQALRLYHSEVLDQVELLVVDNHPDGPCAAPLKRLEKSIPNYRYLPLADRIGTASRDAVVREAGGDLVLCIDCHVFIVPGAVRRLIDYFDANPQSPDLIQGPMIHDDLIKISSHLDPTWRAGMFGTWATDPAAADPEGEPFEIRMHGLGLFACRRTAWPGFNPLFRGFGGEEGYIHEKFRRKGGRVLCLPFLRWMHRFERPLGIPYPNTWEDRLHNYLVGFGELGLPTDALEAHFAELLGEGVAARILRQVRGEIGAAGAARAS